MTNTVIRSLHDIGAAAWFGGSLMGAIGLNGASTDLHDPRERAHVAAAGWARWAPIAGAAIGTHLVGGLGLLIANRSRVTGQRGVTANTGVKAALTLAAIAYSGILGAKIADQGSAETDGATRPSARTPAALADAQVQLRILQWVTPALTGALIVLGAQQGEQQRPAEMIKGRARKALARVHH